MPEFEERAPALAATLASLYHAQGASLEARLLKAGRAELQERESRVKQGVERLIRAEPNRHIGEVVLMPDAALTTPRATDTAAGGTDEDHSVWLPEHFGCS
jgi:hypothetical protein